MKNERQEKILEIISTSDVETQEALLDRLRQAGFAVTQATVSRDIRELQLIKVASKGGVYKYAQRENDEGRQSAKYVNILRETVVSVENANNMIVIKTYSGMAQAAAAAIDALLSESILGCIAGDDTIFAVARTHVSAVAIVKQIQESVGIEV